MANVRELVDIISLNDYNTDELLRLFTEEEEQKLTSIQDKIQELRRNNLELKDLYERIEGDKSEYNDLFFNIAKLQALTIKNLIRKNNMKKLKETLEQCEKSKEELITDFQKKRSKLERDLQTLRREVRIAREQEKEAKAKKDELQITLDAIQTSSITKSIKTKQLYDYLIKKCPITNKGDDTCRRYADEILKRTDAKPVMKTLATQFLN